MKDNEGFSPLLNIMQVMGITIGPYVKSAADARDNERVRKAEAAHSAASKEHRLTLRQERTAQNEFYEQEEGVLYGPGIAD